jgi:hypothetical protein
MLLTHETRTRLQEVIDRARHDLAYFARAFFGIEPCPRQADALTLGGRCQVKVAGRRFGKSTLTLIELVHHLATGAGRVWYVTAPSIDQTKIYFSELEQRAEENPLLAGLLRGPIKWSPFPYAELITGSQLMGRSTARDGLYLRGKRAHGVAISEAAFVKDKVYQDVIRALVLDTNGLLRLETTPNGMNYVYGLYQTGLSDPTGYYRSFHAAVYDNTRLDRDEIERIRREIPELAWRVEYMAEFVDDDAAIFPWSLLVELFDDYQPAPHGPLPGHSYSIGVDLAKYQDYTAVIVLDTTAAPYRLAEWHRYQGRLYSEVAAQVNELQAKYRARVYLDATGVGDAVAEQIQSCEPFVFSERTRSELISNLVVLAQQRQLQLPSSWTVLRDELRYFRNVRHGGHVKAEATGGQHDDTVMALALACWPARSGRAPLDPGIRDLFRRASIYD